MIKFVNRLTGTIMWVADERKDEYLRAGHRLALSCAKPSEVADEEEPKKVAPKKATKKAQSKKK